MRTQLNGGDFLSFKLLQNRGPFLLLCNCEMNRFAYETTQNIGKLSAFLFEVIRVGTLFTPLGVSNSLDCDWLMLELVSILLSSIHYFGVAI